MKKYLLLFFTILLSLSQYTATSQTTLFSDDFGAPGAGVQTRNTWPYMATGGNAFVFAGPNAPNMGGQSFSESKAIENNFYAVVGPKYIYSSVGLSNVDPVNMDGVYVIWKELIAAGDATPGHNGNGGALVINAGTTLSSIYSRETGLQAGKYYKLSYKIFVQNPIVKINHVILSPSGTTEMAKHLSPDDGQGAGTKTWKQQEYWFYVPTGCAPGNYGISIYNASALNNGNDLAIDDVLFQSYETADVPAGIIGTTAVAEIECAIPEPVAVDDTVSEACSGTALATVTFSHNGTNNILANDFAQGTTTALSNVSISLIVPAGASNSSSNYSGDYGNSKTQTVTIAGQGEWALKEGRTVVYDNATAGPKITGFPTYELKFTPNVAFTGNPTPLQYTITNLEGGSAKATINLLYACNPIAVDDSATMTAGTPVTVTILTNDQLANGTPATATNVTVGLIDPNNPIGTPTTSVTIPGEGVWSYATGGLTFTPESGFTSNPTPIQYKITGTVSGRTSAPATVTVTVAAAPSLSSDLSIVKTVDKVTPNVGDNVIFTLTATNNGPDNNTLVQVQDLLPSGYTFVSTTATGTAYDAATGLWTIGTLNNAASRSITITAKATDVNNYTNTATISGANTDPITTNNVATASIISAISCPSAGISGNSMLDGLQFLAGTGSATDIKVDDYLLRPNSFNIGGIKYDVVLKIETLELRGAGKLEISQTGSLIGNLQLAAIIPNNNPYVVYKFSIVESGSATVSNPTGTTATIPRMWVTLSDIDGIDGVRNSGDVSGYSTADAPEGVISGSALVNLGLQTGNPTGFNLYRPSAIPGPNELPLAFTNAVQMYYDNFSSGTFLFGVTGTNTAPASRAQVAYIRSEEVCDANLAIEKTVDNKTPSVGGTVTFTLKATNAGPSDATNVVVVDNVPAGYTVTSVTPSAGTWTAPNWTIGNLANGATATLTVVATVNATGSYLNKATISGSEKDPKLLDNEDEETITSKSRTKLITNPMIYQKVK